MDSILVTKVRIQREKNWKIGHVNVP